MTTREPGKHERRPARRRVSREQLRTIGASLTEPQLRALVRLLIDAHPRTAIALMDAAIEEVPVIPAPRRDGDATTGRPEMIP
jgi:hypothetical protein